MSTYETVNTCISGGDMVTFLFSVHTITEAKQYAGQGQGEARA